jgi:hypothetical protein
MAFNNQNDELSHRGLRPAISYLCNSSYLTLVNFLLNYDWEMPAQGRHDTNDVIKNRKVFMELAK